MHHELSTIAGRLRSTPRQAAAGDALHDLVVVPALREAIVSNLLRPGTRLTETGLAQTLGVSRTPVREALSQLEREGLVTVVPRLGVFVREVTERDVEETYAVRAVLESLAVRLATEHRSAVGVAQLDEVLGEMAKAVTAADEVHYTAALDRYYAVLFAMADNKTLEATHRSLLGPVRRLRRIAMTRPGRMKASHQQAVRIRDAIARGSPDGPRLMRQQLEAASNAAIAALRAGRAGAAHRRR